jgi:hypothetical protein
MVNEIGRELKANELKVKTIVVLSKVGRPSATYWVSGIGQDYVMFYAGLLNMTLIAYLREDGTLADDSGIQLHVYEYLGEV